MAAVSLAGRIKGRQNAVKERILLAMGLDDHQKKARRKYWTF
jgi:hypothetical protein